uniref:Uncharacterized protein n=1 Tax=Setaria viridis TaxID=4556 RepID=A0A4V6D8W6_SETVI|nr:hypothetical protein SEVIR_4G301801v2 [Setaria viridis]
MPAFFSAGRLFSALPFWCSVSLSAFQQIHHRHSSSFLLPFFLKKNNLNYSVC